MCSHYDATRKTHVKVKELPLIIDYREEGWLGLLRKSKGEETTTNQEPLWPPIWACPAHTLLGGCLGKVPIASSFPRYLFHHWSSVSRTFTWSRKRNSFRNLCGIPASTCSHVFTPSHGCARWLRHFWSSLGTSDYQRGNPIKVLGRKLESRPWRTREHVVLSEIHENERQATPVAGTDQGIATMSHYTTP